MALVNHVRPGIPGQANSAEDPCPVCASASESENEFGRLHIDSISEDEWPPLPSPHVHQTRLAAHGGRSQGLPARRGCR